MREFDIYYVLISSKHLHFLGHHHEQPAIPDDHEQIKKRLK